MSSSHSNKLTIWGRSNSFNVQKVMWFVNELGLEYKHIPAGGSYGGLDTKQFLDMNPHGRVPVILDNDIAVWESHSILRYLAARYSNGRFWSDNPAIRSQIEPWMDWSQTALQPDFLTGVFWGYYRTPASERNWPAIKKSISRCTEHFYLLNKILQQQPFLCGQSLTLADIPVGTTLYRYFELDIERPFVPYVEAWYERLQERPAYRDHVMIPFHDMRGRQSF